MPHNTKDLQRSRTIMGPTAGQVVSKWDLVTNDAAATVEAANYLNGSASALSKGDKIDAHIAMSGTPVFKSYVVTSATGAATVTIALQATAAG